ncbi:MAG: hypothetical protein R3190_05780 [Thermoanaerobaculia bacterium]|nr:hypothetical protein [Thermoanaerobaculia bacterium]
MLAILESAFGSWSAREGEAARLEHLSWKLEAPCGGFSVLGRKGERLVTLMNVVRSRVRLAGKERDRLAVVDAAVHREHQGEGYGRPRYEIFNATEVARAPHLRITRAVHPAIEKVLADQRHRPLAAPVHPLLRVFDVRRCGADWLAGEGVPAPTAVAFALAGAGAIGRLAGPGSAPAADLEIETADRPAADAEDLFTRCAAAFELIGVRSREQLSWRYFDSRGGRFEMRSARVGGRLMGYAVTKVEGRRGYLVDVLAEPGRSDVASALVADAVLRLRRAEVSGVLCWCPRHHPLRPILRRHGFADPRRRLRLLFRAEKLGADEIAVLESPSSRIHFMLGDTDEV